jgi:TolA-binding protein
MFMHLKMKAEDIKLVFISVALVVSLACCVSLSRAAVSASADTSSQSKEGIVSVEEETEAGETGTMIDVEEKDCDKAIESIQEQSSRIDNGMSEIQEDLEELKKRRKIKKTTKKKTKTKKVIDK